MIKKLYIFISLQIIFIIAIMMIIINDFHNIKQIKNLKSENISLDLFIKENEIHYDGYNSLEELLLNLENQKSVLINDKETIEKEIENINREKILYTDKINALK